INYQFQGGYGEISEEFSPRAALTASWTNDTFGVLVGVAGVRNKSTTKGFETIGWTNPGLTCDQSGVAPPDGQAPNSTASGDCNATGGGNWRIPDAVPVGAGNGLEEGRALDAAYLQQLNPGLSIQQISDALIPRLARPAYLDGTRERYSALVSLEYRPTETMNFYLDALYADANREFDRLDVNLVGRNCNMIPIGMQVDDNNVVTNATFANAQFFLEARPYDEEVDFYNINPGAHFQVTDWLGIDAQLNKSRSVFFREAPTLLFNTPFTTVQYSNTGGNTPKITSNLNLNDPDIG